MSLTIEEFDESEKNISQDIIYNLVKVIGQNYIKIGITYISTLGVDSPKQFIIFHPFISESQYYSKSSFMPYVFIREFSVTISLDFYKYIYNYEKLYNKNIIGEIINKKLCSWKIYNSGDSKDLFILENDIKKYYNTFEEWIADKNINNYKIHLQITNPMKYRMPFIPNDLEIQNIQGAFKKVPPFEDFELH